MEIVCGGIVFGCVSAAVLWRSVSYPLLMPKWRQELNW